MAPGASRLSRPLLPGLDFDAPPALQEAWPAEPQARQDHRPRTPEPGPDARRGAPGEETQAPSPGPLFDRPQGRPPFRDGADRAGQAAHSTRPDGERCPGDGARGATEPPVSRVTDLLDLSAAAFPRRSQSLRPPSHTPGLAPAGLPRSNPSSSSAAPPRPRPRPRTARQVSRRSHKRLAPSSPERRSRPKKTTWRAPRSRHIPPLPAARRPRPATSSPPSARSSTSSRKGGRPTPDERQALARFGGFGPVALSIFPDPVTGRYKDAGWQALGEELRIAAHARGIRQRQAHHLQRLLHVAHRHRGHARGPRPPRRATRTPPSSSPAAAPAIS